MQIEKCTLFMLLLGCKPAGRHTEQHDIFFSIGTCLSDLKDEIINSWPEAKGRIHIDAWREVTHIDGYKIVITPGNGDLKKNGSPNLFFLNLGGYKKSEFDEFHYKLLVGARNKKEAVIQAKQTAFYKHTGFRGAPSHIDDEYGVDIDDAFKIQDVLSLKIKEKYSILLVQDNSNDDDEVHLGYLRIEKI